MNLRPLLIGTLASALATALAAALAVPATATPATGTPAAATGQDTILIGHRGAAGVAPENTLPAISAGSRSGAQFIEIDVQLTRDGVPFIFHDATPARTTNVAEVFPGRENDPITSFSWAELRRLDAGAYFGEDFTGTRIPHFNQVPGALTGRTGVFIEIKDPANSPGIEQVVADALAGDPRWNRLLLDGKIEVLGFDADSNRRFARLAPQVPLQQLAGSVPAAEQLADYAGYADALGTNYRQLDTAGAQRVKDAGLGLGVYTVNSVQAADAALALGVQRITGDFPRQLARHLDGRRPFPSNNGVVIARAVNDVPGNDLAFGHGEHVVLANIGVRTIDVGGYLVRDAANNVLRIGPGHRLAPGEELRVYPGPGDNGPRDDYIDGGAAILNNGEDSLALWDAKGTLAHTYSN